MESPTGGLLSVQLLPAGWGRGARERGGRDLILDPQESIGRSQTKAKYSTEVKRGAEAGPLQYEMQIMKPEEGTFTSSLNRDVWGGFQDHKLPQVKAPHLPGGPVLTGRCARGRGQEEVW